MACQPSSTFLLVASSTSNAGTICPAAIASILMPPWVSFSVRSANILKCSCSVLLAGQVDCILTFFGAGACAAAVVEKAAVTIAAAVGRLFILKSSPGDRPKLRPGSRGGQRDYPCAMRLVCISLFLCLALVACLATAQNGRFVVRLT